MGTGCSFVVTTLVAIFYTTTFVIEPCLCFRVIVDVNSEECFYDHVAVGGKFGVTFEVIEGGFLDIDFNVRDPTGSIIYSQDRESSGRLSFTATTEGRYSFCFNNHMSTVTPKEVMFAIESGDDKPLVDKFDDYSSLEKEEIQPEKLEKMIRELKWSIHRIKEEQDYMEVRDRVHSKINESTNLRVTWWVFFEASMVLGVTIAQIIYLKRFFEVRRMV